MNYTISSELEQLYRQLEYLYQKYRANTISEQKYLDFVRPIDEAIGDLEKATLQDTPVWKEAFLQHFPMQEH